MRKLIETGNRFLLARTGRLSPEEQLREDLRRYERAMLELVDN